MVATTPLSIDCNISMESIYRKNSVNEVINIYRKNSAYADLENDRITCVVRHWQNNNKRNNDISSSDNNLNSNNNINNSIQNCLGCLSILSSSSSGIFISILLNNNKVVNHSVFLFYLINIFCTHKRN